jgi:hypothetical protein
MTREIPGPDLDDLAMETPVPAGMGRRSPEDPNEILLDDAEASGVVDDDDFMSLVNEDKGNEEIDDDE